MKFNMMGEASLNGVCAEAECRTVDAYLENKIAYARKHLLPAMAYLVADHNAFVTVRVEQHVRVRDRQIAKLREKQAAA